MKFAGSVDAGLILGCSEVTGRLILGCSEREADVRLRVVCLLLLAFSRC